MPALEELLILLDVEVVCTRQVGTARELECELGVVERRKDVRNDRLLVHADAKDLTLLVDADNTVRRLMLRRDEDGLTRNSVHIEACSRLEIVEMDETIFRDQVDDTVLLGHLHRDGEVIRGLRWEVDVDSLLGEWWVGGLVVNLDDMQL